MRALNVGRLTLGAGIIKACISLDLWIELIDADYSDSQMLELLGTLGILKFIYDYLRWP